MQESEGSQLEKALLEKALRLQAGRVGFEAVVPNPKLKLLDQVRKRAGPASVRPCIRAPFMVTASCARGGGG